jgi:hypothetical protein
LCSNLFTVCFAFCTQRLQLFRHLAHHLHEHLGGSLLRASIVVVSLHRGSCSSGRSYRNLSIQVGCFDQARCFRFGSTSYPFLGSSATRGAHEASAGKLCSVAPRQEPSATRYPNEVLAGIRYRTARKQSSATRVLHDVLARIQSSVAHRREPSAARRLTRFSQEPVLNCYLRKSLPPIVVDGGHVG